MGSDPSIEIFEIEEDAPVALDRGELAGADEAPDRGRSPADVLGGLGDGHQTVLGRFLSAFFLHSLVELGGDGLGEGIH